LRIGRQLLAQDGGRHRHGKRQRVLLLAHDRPGKFIGAMRPTIGNTRLGDRRLDRPAQEITNRPGLAKADFLLGRVRIHIDPGRIHVQVQDKGGPAVAIEDVAISGTHRAREQLVANRPPVEKHVLQVRLTARVHRAAPASHAKASRPIHAGCRSRCR
jgi:hypothetical protein